MARRALNFDLEDGGEINTMKKLYNYPDTPFLRNPPPFLGANAYFPFVEEVKKEERRREKEKEEEEEEDDMDIIEGLLGKEEEKEEEEDGMDDNEVLFRRAGRAEDEYEYIIRRVATPPLRIQPENPWKIRQSVYNMIQWKDNTSDLNLREIAYELGKDTEKDEEFSSLIDKLKIQIDAIDQLHFESNIISNTRFGNKLRRFTATDSWARYPIIAIKYFNYSFEKPMAGESECSMNDEECIICGSSCTKENLSGCCSNIYTCLNCVESMNDFSCPSCGGILMTTGMRASHIMKIDANIRRTKLIKENFSGLLVSIIERYKDNNMYKPGVVDFLDKEGPNNTFYDVLRQALDKYEDDQRLKSPNFFINVEEFIDSIDDLSEIMNAAFEKTKESYIAIHRGFIAKKFIDVWSREHNIDVMELDKYREAIDRLEDRIILFHFIEDYFDEGNFDQIELLYTDDEVIKQFYSMPTTDIMQEFNKIYYS